jgi:predicted NUDIX family phosphoesterase
VVIDLPNTFDAALMEKFVDAIEVRAAEMTTSSFQTNLGHLAEYRDKHGHVNVKQTEVTEAEFPLGTWLNKQRMAYKKGSLSPERVAALNNLGVIWDPFEEAFQTNLCHLAAYKTKHGHVNVKKTEVTEAGFTLGEWLMKQRMAYKKGSLSPERAAALEDLGVIWDPFEEAFQTNLAHLAAYRGKHGHINVKQTEATEAGSALGTWLNKQRMAYKKGSLSPERAAALEDLGVIWDPLEEAFQTNLGHLAEYRDKHGHTNVPNGWVTADGYKLGSWLSTRRMAYKKGSLSPERAAALEYLGVIWDTLEQAFQTNLAHLAAYRGKHGHINVKKTEVTADGFHLGAWLSDQRAAYKKGSLSPERAAALEALGVVWAPKAARRRTEKSSPQESRVVQREPAI